VKNCLILEDDAQLIRSKLSFFEEAVKEIPEKWELFYLGYKPSSPLYEKHKIGRLLIRIKHLLKPYKKGNGISSCTAKYRFFSKSFSKHLNLPGVYAGTHAYALSNYGAKKIVNLDSPLRYGFDNALMHANYYKLINSYSLKKVLFVQNEFFETSLNN
jgi:glycosyl transferase family 25